MNIELWLVRKETDIGNNRGIMKPHIVFLTHDIAHGWIMDQPTNNGLPVQCYGPGAQFGTLRIHYDGFSMHPLTFPIPEGMELNTERPTRQMKEFLQTINTTIATIL